MNCKSACFYKLEVRTAGIKAYDVVLEFDWFNDTKCKAG